MTAYYNEHDPLKAETLREAIKDEAIAPGDVDERSIADVQPAYSNFLEAKRPVVHEAGIPIDASAIHPALKPHQRVSVEWLARWQVDAHGFTRSSGNRLLSPEDLSQLAHDAIFKLFRDFNLENVYDFEQHVKIGEALEAKGILPVTFMLLQPPSWHPDVWSDVTRMLTLNGAQSAKGKEMHLCPMQIDLADRVINQFSMPGEVVFDPFAGLGTVPLRAISLGRRGYGVELSPQYWLDACGYLKAAEQKMSMPTLFDVLPQREEVIMSPFAVMGPESTSAPNAK